MAKPDLILSDLMTSCPLQVLGSDMTVVVSTSANRHDCALGCCSAPVLPVVASDAGWWLPALGLPHSWALFSTRVAADA